MVLLSHFSIKKLSSASIIYIARVVTTNSQIGDHIWYILFYFLKMQAYACCHGSFRFIKYTIKASTINNIFDIHKYYILSNMIKSIVIHTCWRAAASCKSSSASEKFMNHWLKEWSLVSPFLLLLASSTGTAFTSSFNSSMEKGKLQITGVIAT